MGSGDMCTGIFTPAAFDFRFGAADSVLYFVVCTFGWKVGSFERGWVVYGFS